MKTVCIVYSKASNRGESLVKKIMRTIKDENLSIKGINTNKLKRNNALRVYDEILDSDFVVTIFDQETTDCLVEIGYAIGINTEVVLALLPRSRPPAILKKMRAIFLTESDDDNVKIVYNQMVKSLKKKERQDKLSDLIDKSQNWEIVQESCLKKYVFKNIESTLGQERFRIDWCTHQKYGADFTIYDSVKQIMVACVVKKSTKNYPIDDQDVWELSHVAKDTKANAVFLVSSMNFTDTAVDCIQNNKTISVLDIYKLRENIMGRLAKLAGELPKDSIQRIDSSDESCRIDTDFKEKVCIFSTTKKNQL